MLKLVVLISGGGTNLQAIMDAISQGSLKNTEIISVISNNARAHGLERAKMAGIPTECISPRDFGSREAFYQVLLERLQGLHPDLIVLAGFLVNIPASIVRAFPRRMINIHPSLIPSFCGPGYYGLRVHEAALNRGVKITGATVHFVEEGIDTGEILLQKAVQVEPGDTPERLQRRVMEEAEWIILPKAIEMIGNGEII